MAETLFIDAEYKASIKTIIPIFAKNKIELEFVISNISKLSSVPQINEICLIDDRPEKPLPSEFENRALDFQKVSLIKNKTNKGFVISVNENFCHQHDFNFIVNSDVLMMDFDLERVLRKFDKVKRLATVTFTTNEASIFSILPHLKNQDTWFAEYKKIPTKKQFFDLPTAIGHSFFVRSSALKGRLPFNNLFSPGYGEETEMSLWLSDKGFSHKLFFGSGHFHAGSQSFGSIKANLQKQNIKKLLCIYPDYFDRVNEYISTSEFLAFSSSLHINEVVRQLDKRQFGQAATKLRQKRRAKRL